MNNITFESLTIEDMIYEIRGKQVMLASDVAQLYNSETKIINQVVKRNINRFPIDFCFQLTKEENINLRSQIVTSNNNQNLGIKNETIRGGNRYLPYVFTEYGVIMLSGLLKSDIAAEVNVRVINAFVKIRHYIIENKDVYKSLNNINNLLIEHDEKINYIFSKFDKKEYLFLPGEIYDAYCEIVNILNESQKEIVIIDAYADKIVFDFMRNINSKIILITSSKAKLSNTEIDKFNKQYNNKLNIIQNNTFHDRYFIIDKKEIYHMGTSLNHAGEKMFSLNKLEDNIVKDHLLNYVFEIIKK